MPSRKLEDLHPTLQPLCKAFLEEAEKQGVDVLVTCTYRSNEEQEDLYKIGRTKPNPTGAGVSADRPYGYTVTRARAGQSSHNFTMNGLPASKAFDVVPLYNGKPMWNEKFEGWQKLGAIGVALGLEWYGTPGSRYREFPHFQLKKESV